MSVPPELMKMMGKPGGGMPPGMPGQHAPVSAPMSTPQPNAGEKQGAMTQVQLAMDILERTLPAFGTETPEGAAVLDVLGKLGKSFGGAQRDKSKEMIPSEIMNLMASLPKGMAPGGAPGGPGGAPHPMPGAGGPPGAPPGGGMPPGMPPPAQ